jgi:hypothetical protein
MFVAGPPPVFEYSGHFYELSSFPTNWTSARDDTASRTYRGMPGHLMTMTEYREAPAVKAFFQLSSFWLAATNTSGAWIWTDGPEANMTVPSQMSVGILPRTGECAMYTGGSRITSSSCDVPRFFVIEYECDLTSSIDDCYGIL